MASKNIFLSAVIVVTGVSAQAQGQKQNDVKPISRICVGNFSGDTLKWQLETEKSASLIKDHNAETIWRCIPVYKDDRSYTAAINPQSLATGCKVTAHAGDMIEVRSTDDEKNPLQCVQRRADGSEGVAAKYAPASRKVSIMGEAFGGSGPIANTRVRLFDEGNKEVSIPNTMTAANGTFIIHLNQALPAGFRVQVGALATQVDSFNYDEDFVSINGATTLADAYAEKMHVEMGTANARVSHFLDLPVNMPFNQSTVGVGSKLFNPNMFARENIADLVTEMHNSEVVHPFRPMLLKGAGTVTAPPFDFTKWAGMAVGGKIVEGLVGLGFNAVLDAAGYVSPEQKEAQRLMNQIIQTLAALEKTVDELKETVELGQIAVPMTNLKAKIEVFRGKVQKGMNKLAILANGQPKTKDDLADIQITMKEVHDYIIANGDDLLIEINALLTKSTVGSPSVLEQWAKVHRKRVISIRYFEKVYSIFEYVQDAQGMIATATMAAFYDSKRNVSAKETYRIFKEFVAAQKPQYPNDEVMQAIVTNNTAWRDAIYKGEIFVDSQNRRLWSTRFGNFSNPGEAEAWNREYKAKNIDLRMATGDEVRDMYSVIENAKETGFTSPWTWVGFTEADLQKNQMVDLCCSYIKKVTKGKKTIDVTHLYWFGLDRGPFTQYNDSEADFNNVRKGKGLNGISILRYLDIK